MIDSKIGICAIMLMGGKEEPFLEHCLASLAGAVDFVVINDNSNLPDHANLTIVKQSTLFKEQKIHLVASTFLGFGPCRELCMNYLRQANIRPDWIIFVDCDEVHHSGLVPLTRRLLPALPLDVGIVDGYFWQYYQHHDYVVSLDHRHNMIFR